MNVSSRLAAVAAVTSCALLVGCGLFPEGKPLPSTTGVAQSGVETAPQLPSPSVYAGPDAAILTVNAVDMGSCFIEGSLHYARIEGPMVSAWLMDQPVPTSSVGALGPNSRFPIGSESLGMVPGSYKATFWQRPCDANCGNLDGIVSECTATFTAQPAEHLRIDVMFPLEKQCTVIVTP